MVKAITIFLFFLYSVVNGNMNVYENRINSKFLVDTHYQIKALDSTIYTQIPDGLDWRINYPKCFKYIKNQGKCASSYAISVAASLESRICINSKGSKSLELSPQDILSCGFREKKCKEEANLKETWEWAEQYGLITEKCLPYLSKEGTIIPECPNRCIYPNDPFYKYKAVINSFHNITGIENIKLEIILYGPVTSVMTVYEDLALYNGGIYQYEHGNPMNNLSVVIVGWGKENGTEFWIIRNTWGKYWGENGYFKIKINDPKSNIENNVGVSNPLI